MFRLSLPLALLAVFALGPLACDDDKAPTEDRKSVIDGGTPESAAGRKVEAAKKEIEAVEKKMEEEDADRFERSGGEKVQRGVP